MRPNPTCPVCDHGATDAASIRVHNLRVATDGERSYGIHPYGHAVKQMLVRHFSPNTVTWPERPAAWLNREFGAFAPALLGRVPEGER